MAYTTRKLDQALQLPGELYFCSGFRVVGYTVDLFGDTAHSIIDFMYRYLGVNVVK